MSKQANRYRKDGAQVKSAQKHKWEVDRQMRGKQHVQTLTAKQDSLLRAIESSTVILATGSSGTGKTYIACHAAANMLLSGEIKKIVITRPYVALANRTTGFKPSTDLEKLRGFILPMLAYLGEALGHVVS